MKSLTLIKTRALDHLKLHCCEELPPSPQYCYIEPISLNVVPFSLCYLKLFPALEIQSLPSSKGLATLYPECKAIVVML